MKSAAIFARCVIIIIICSLSSTTSLEVKNGRNAPLRICIIGGGTSGMFAAVAATEALQQLQNSDSNSNIDDIEICVFESAPNVLRLVPKDGNILHDTSQKLRDLLMDGYPRGRKEITSILTKSFPPIQLQKWFESKGVEFQTLKDGRMVVAIPEDDESISSKSQSIIVSSIVDSISDTIKLNMNHKVSYISQLKSTNRYLIGLSSSSVENNEHPVQLESDCVVLATGSSFQGHSLAKLLGHSIVKPSRSNFAFLLHPDIHLIGKLLDGTPPGVYTAPFVRVSFKLKIPGQKKPRVFKKEGHIDLQVAESWSVEGNDMQRTASLSGNAILKISSFAARELQACQCKGKLFIHFCPEVGAVEKVESFLWEHRQTHSKDVVYGRCPFVYTEIDYDKYDWETETFAVDTTDCVPQELWASLCAQVRIKPNLRWGNLSPKIVRALAEILVGCPIEFVGRSSSVPSSSDFINAGGISLKEIDFKSMESKLCNGLFCCGQVLDVDGWGGGYNFMIDAATGHIAGSSALDYTFSLMDHNDQ